MKIDILSTKDEIKYAINWFENIVKNYGIASKAVLVFNELLLNAYEHGNLQIHNKEELIQKNRLKDVIEKREKCCKKRITIKVEKIGNYLFTKICDEGKGFDTSKLVSNRFSGRGIYLAKKLADKLIYNEKGNGVCFIMKLTPKALLPAQ